MHEAIKLLQNLSAMSAHAQNRHAVIAQNIANADTPGYKAKDFPEFSTIFQSVQTGSVRDAMTNATLVTIQSDDVASPNGNTVSLEQQTMLAAQTKMDHEMSLAVYRKALDIMKMAMSKNI